MEFFGVFWGLFHVVGSIFEAGRPQKLRTSSRWTSNGDIISGETWPLRARSWELTSADHDGTYDHIFQGF